MVSNVEAFLPLTFSLGTLDSDWVPASYSIAFTSSHFRDSRPRVGELVLEVPTVREPALLPSICYRIRMVTSENWNFKGPM